MSLHEITEVAETVNAAADREANIIFGAVVDESLGDTLWVTVVATGFDATSEEVLTAQVEEATRHDHPAATETGTEAGAGASAGIPAATQSSREAPWTESTGSGASDDELEVPPFLR